MLTTLLSARFATRTCYQNLGDPQPPQAAQSIALILTHVTNSSHGHRDTSIFSWTSITTRFDHDPSSASSLHGLDSAKSYFTSWLSIRTLHKAHPLSMLVALSCDMLYGQHVSWNTTPSVKHITQCLCVANNAADVTCFTGIPIRASIALKMTISFHRPLCSEHGDLMKSSIGHCHVRQCAPCTRTIYFFPVDISRSLPLFTVKSQSRTSEDSSASYPNYFSQSRSKSNQSKTTSTPKDKRPKTRCASNSPS